MTQENGAPPRNEAPPENRIAGDLTGQLTENQLALLTRRVEERNRLKRELERRDREIERMIAMRFEPGTVSVQLDPLRIVPKEGAPAGE